MALPAYDQCIKASHLFNLLDARGVISVTERQSYILRVRELAKACCAAWLKTAGGRRMMSPEIVGRADRRRSRAASLPTWRCGAASGRCSGSQLALIVVGVGYLVATGATADIGVRMRRLLSNAGARRSNADHV